MNATQPVVLTRNKAQEASMTLLYNALLRLKVEETLDLQQLMTNFFDCEYDDVDLFVKEIMIKGIKHHDVIVEQVSSHLKNWSFDRLNMLTQAIFFLAYTHFHYVGDVDKKVVIDNAVKLTKKFADEGDYKFVNAILDKIL